MRERIRMLGLVGWCVLSAAILALAQENPSVKITNGPVVESATATSATIAWSTNVNASTILKYGTDATNLTQRAEVPWGGLTHRITLQNLQPNTTYYFQVQSTEGQGTGTNAVSSMAEFKTQSSPANPDGATQSKSTATFHVIAGPIPQELTVHSAKLWWATNESVAGSSVRYGTSLAVLNQFARAADSGNGLNHTAELTNLRPGTTYTARIVRSDKSISAETSFKTLPANYAKSKNIRITHGPVVERVAENQATVAWDTSVPSSSIVKYGMSATALNHTAEAPWTAGTHRVTLNDLQPNTKYFFQVESTQARGTGSATQGGAYPFQTVQAGQAAMNIRPQ
jgi:phosphodiesterase/alkaline phosphatase D-like protein